MNEEGFFVKYPLESIPIDAARIHHIPVRRALCYGVLLWLTGILICSGCRVLSVSLVDVRA